jgi:cell division protein FtsL
MAIEVVFEKRINNATVYREVDVEQRRQIYLLTSLAVLFGFGVLLYGWQQFQWIRFGYEIESMEKQKDELVKYQNNLLVERETLMQFERIVSIAQDDLGMVAPAPGQFVTLTSEEFPAGTPLSAQEVR